MLTGLIAHLMLDYEITFLVDFEQYAFFIDVSSSSMIFVAYDVAVT